MCNNKGDIAWFVEVWPCKSHVTLNEMSWVKTNSINGFLDNDFLYDGNTYWISTGNNNGDIAWFV